MSETNFVSAVRTTLTDIFGGNVPCGKKILVGLSGGADSVALTLSLLSLSRDMGFSLSCCHINHMIRGDEADRDEAFSRNLCERLGIPFYSEKFDVPAISRKEKKGLEQTARDVRYAYFDSLCTEGIADYIATAHTASDNAETVIFNITRGSGLSGICGIPKKRGNIIRPLINITREEIEEFLSEMNQDYVTDSTNLIDDCSRNVIRLNVIPELRKINPSTVSGISKLSELCVRDNEYLEKEAERHRTDDIALLSQLPTAILSRIIGAMYREKTGYLPSMVHTDMLCREIYKVGEKCGEFKSFDLPGEITIRFECGKIRLLCKSENVGNNYSEYDIVPENGINELCGGEILAVYGEKLEDNKESCERLSHKGSIYTLFMETRLFSDIIKGKIHLRSGKSGDKIRISGMSKDVKKMYSAKKIPVDLRKYLPRICDGEGEILSLPYVGVCDAQHGFYDSADIIIRLYLKDDKE